MRMERRIDMKICGYNVTEYKVGMYIPLKRHNLEIPKLNKGERIRFTLLMQLVGFCFVFCVQVFVRCMC